MKEKSAEFYHGLLGVKKTRITYQKKDFLDYVLMAALCSLLSGLIYGVNSVLAVLSYALCAFMVAAFIVRHGVELRFPIIVKRPQEVLYMFVQKATNMYVPYFVAFGVFLLEQGLIYLTPNWPHKLELTQKIAVYLFYIHLLAISIYRTVILVDHFRKRKKVRMFLEETNWKRSLNHKYSVHFELLHAYFTGLLTHLILVAPWYFIITHFSFSLLFLPAVCIANVWVSKKIADNTNSWYYRDHWLGHNSEFEFVYLHGSHHDAIPSGLIAVAGNGFIEGFTRYTFGYPDVFYNPLVAFFYFTFGIKLDIQLHQYIPGVFPRLSRDAHRVYQHSIHHFGKLEPYGYGIKVDQPNLPQEVLDMTKGAPDSLANSIKLDERLTGFNWDNAKYRWYLKLFEKYND